MADAKKVAVSQFYNDKDPVLPATFTTLLRRKLNLTDAELVQHVRGVRDKAWEVVQYPCIGQYLFLDISITSHPRYSLILQRVIDGDQFLDIGVGLGENLRQLAVDGAPENNLHGCDLQSSFFDLGHDMFGDKGDFVPHLWAEDFFGSGNASQLKPGSFDIVHAADFFPLFGLEQQTMAATRMLQLLKKKPGSLIFGRNIVAFGKPMEIPAGQLDTDATGHYVHTADSFMKMLDDVATSTGIKFQRGAEVYTYRRNATRPGGWERRLRFWMMLDDSVNE